MFAISAVHSLLYVYVAEVFPTSVRSIGTAFALFGDEIGEGLRGNKHSFLWSTLIFTWCSQSWLI